jgi:putative CocE/NonD family hydrolase
MSTNPIRPERSHCIQAMVPMRDGVRLNTFVFLPEAGGDQYPVILQRTPYGISSPGSGTLRDCTRGWLPSADAPMRGSILRGWQQITNHGYAAVYQDTRGRYGSEGQDRVYADDAEDGFATLNWIAEQDWTNHRVGVSGSSAGSTTALAAASQRHPSVKAFFAQVGGSSIYDDVVYEGASIELERLWLWVSNNIPGLSISHRAAIQDRFGLNDEKISAITTAANARYFRLEAAKRDSPAFVQNEDWMHLPLTDYPEFSIWQPHLNEILSHPCPDEFRSRHNFRSTIDVPGFHVTTWFDIFQTSVIAAFTQIQQRVGNQVLWIGPNAHHFVYEENFWPRDPYFEWFDHWLKDKASELIDRPPVYYSPRAWIAKSEEYVADDWIATEVWPPDDVRVQTLYLRGDGSLKALSGDDTSRCCIYDPRHPIPSLGGRNMSIDGGALDQRPLYALPNYGLIYRSDLLSENFRIAGEVKVTLTVQSDCRDTDFVAKLIELEHNGQATLLMDGVLRVMYRDGLTYPQYLECEDVVQIVISLAHISHTFSSGSCIQIDVTSSNFPRRARNTNSGNPIVANDTESDIRTAKNTIHHRCDLPSFVELPIVP